MALPYERFERVLDKYHYLHTMAFGPNNVVFLDHLGFADPQTQMVDPDTTHIHVFGASKIHDFDEPGLLLRGSRRDYAIHYDYDKTTQVKINPDLSLEVRTEDDVVTPSFMLARLREGFEVIDAYNTHYAPYYALELGNVELGNLRYRRRFSAHHLNQDTRRVEMPIFQGVLGALRTGRLTVK